ncbi:MAG: alpha/beta fold hydrolase [Thermoleophilaceae bacterium]
MKSVILDDVTLEYEVQGEGEPVLLISHVLADAFRPLVSEPALADRHRLIQYHKRGWAGSTHTAPPVSIGTHAADAAALLDHLGVARAHIAGHSSGAAVALQLALDHPQRVQTLTVLEPPLLSLPAGRAFLSQAEPVLELYSRGEQALAVDMFLSAVSGLDSDACRTLLDERLPGAIADAVRDADTFFEIELPALMEWQFTREHAAAIDKPALSVVGAATQPLWVEVAAFLRSHVARLEEVTIEDTGHLLQIERPEPVGQAMAGFFGRHAMADGQADDVVVQAVGGSSPLAHP